MSTFRELNTKECDAINNAYVKGKIKKFYPLVSEIERIEVSYENLQGGFCVCVLIISYTVQDHDLPNNPSESGIKINKYIFRGASRRSYKDAPNSIKGEMLAFRRAILFSRPVELS